MCFPSTGPLSCLLSSHAAERSPSRPEVEDCWVTKSRRALEPEGMGSFHCMDFQLKCKLRHSHRLYLRAVTWWQDDFRSVGKRGLPSEVKCLLERRNWLRWETFYSPFNTFIFVFIEFVHHSAIAYCSKGLWTAFQQAKGKREELQPRTEEIFLIVDYCAHLGNTEDVWIHRD